MPCESPVQTLLEVGLIRKLFIAIILNFGRPMEDNVGSYNFLLEAIDSEGAAAKEQIVIVVRQHSNARIINHQFTLQLDMEKK